MNTDLFNWKDKVHLESGKLAIRNATPKDSEVLCSWWNDGAIMAHAGFPNGIGTSAEEIVETIKQDNDLNRRLILEFESVAIGEMNYRATKEKIAEIGIKICDANVQNKGYGTTLIKMLINYLFNHLGYEK